MKTRNGFVSNSSSSSFIVTFKKKPKTMGELQDAIFGDEVALPNPYASDDDPWSFPASDVTARVWHDLEGQKKLTIEQIAEHVNDYMDGNWVNGYMAVHRPPKNPDFPTPSDGEDWNEFRKKKVYKDWEKEQAQWEAAHREWALNLAKEYVKDN